jgi:hypothetical protein
MVKAIVCKSMNCSRFYPLILNETNYRFLHLHKIVKGFDIGALHSKKLFLDLVHCVVSTLKRMNHFENRISSILS